MRNMFTTRCTILRDSHMLSLSKSFIFFHQAMECSSCRIKEQYFFLISRDMYKAWILLPSEMNLYNIIVTSFSGLIFYLSFLALFCLC